MKDPFPGAFNGGGAREWEQKTGLGRQRKGAVGGDIKGSDGGIRQRRGTVGGERDEGMRGIENSCSGDGGDRERRRKGMGLMAKGWIGRTTTEERDSGKRVKNAREG